MTEIRVIDQADKDGFTIIIYEIIVDDEVVATKAIALAGRPE